MYDVAIIGGGISGLTAATLLGKKGYDVVVLERNQTIGAHNDFQMQGFPAFEMSNLPIRIPRKHLVTKGHLWTSSKTRMSFESSKPLLFLHYRGSQKSIDKHLADLALNEGVTIQTSSELKKLDSGKMIKEITTKDNKRHRTRCILAADGVNSITRRLVGADILRPKGLGLGAVLESVEVEPLEFHGAFSHNIAPLGYSYIIGHPDGKATVAVSIRPKHLELSLAGYFARTLKFFHSVIKNEKPTKFFSGVVTCGEGYHQLVHKNLLFIGEAGGFQDPILGFGMVPAIKSAELASKIVNTALTYTQNQSTFLEQLDQYDRLAKRNFFHRYNFKMSLLIRKHLLETLTDSQIHSLLQTLQGKEQQIEKVLTQGPEHIWPTLFSLLLRNPFLLQFLTKTLRSLIRTRTY
ncbi:MAG: NAD(P)/FAD-dependent oxidoreductase [Candidatus Thorarchaeota archaeon]